MTGRPSAYTDELAVRICEMLEEGRSLRSICLADNMPTARTVHNWLNANDTFFQQYQRAREIQADTLFDECLDIADENINDVVLRDGVETVNQDVIARAKLKIDTRKWMAGKLKPKAYSDKQVLEHVGADGGAIKTESATDVELARQVAFLLAKGIQGAE